MTDEQMDALYPLTTTRIERNGEWSRDVVVPYLWSELRETFSDGGNLVWPLAEYLIKATNELATLRAKLEESEKIRTQAAAQWLADQKAITTLQTLRDIAQDKLLSITDCKICSYGSASCSVHQQQDGGVRDEIKKLKDALKTIRKIAVTDGVAAEIVASEALE